MLLSQYIPRERNIRKKALLTKRHDIFLVELVLHILDHQRRFTYLCIADHTNLPNFERENPKGTVEGTIARSEFKQTFRGRAPRDYRCVPVLCLLDHISVETQELRPAVNWTTL